MVARPVVAGLLVLPCLLLAACSSGNSAPKLYTTCTLGFDDNGTFLPATVANASAGYPTAAKVTFTVEGAGGVTLTGFDITSTYHGRVVTQQNAASGVSGLPLFIAHGETWKWVVDFADLPDGVYGSESTYLGSQCSVGKWFTN